ncbi:MAG: hypothetical protein A4E55_01209 [Pelotomaculum sp. PtaU1.Bin035]|nr:MAG: hypothetical protein A4E55_01209 [Pelotomaculum sp. PtaU1.Bin035]
MDTYKELIKEVFQSVSQAIGIHAMLLVLEHALWKTKQQYEEAALIKLSEEGVFLAELNQLNPDKAKEISHYFIMSIVDTLGRLVGIQLANQLTKQLRILDSEV